MPEGKKIRIKVRTVHSIYIGDVLVPAMRNRVSDLFNDEERVFINLTDVSVDNQRERAAFVCLNKNMVESITPVD